MSDSSSEVISGGIEVSGKIRGSSCTIDSAGTLTLGDANLQIVNGTTNIASIYIGDWTPGSEATLIFKGELTLSHNGTAAEGSAPVLLGGSDDLDTIEDTVLKIIFDGSYWQEVSRKTR